MKDDCPYLSAVTHISRAGEHAFCCWCPCSPPCPDGEWLCADKPRLYHCAYATVCGCRSEVARAAAGWVRVHTRWMARHELQQRAEGVYAMARWYEHKRAIERKCKYSGGNTCSVCGKRIRNDSIWCPSCAQTVKVERARMRKVAA